MVDIDFIKTTCCPICGCHTIVAESVEVDTFSTDRKLRRHCDGGRWEHREFKCGFKVAYIPNYSGEEAVQKCAFDPDEAIRKATEETVRNAIKAQIDMADCSDKYKDRLREAIKYL